MHTQIMTLMTAPLIIIAINDKDKIKVHTAQSTACTKLFIFAPKEAPKVKLGLQELFIALKP